LAASKAVSREKRRMRGNDASRAAGVGDDEDRDRRSDIGPSALRRNRPCETHLEVQPAERLLEVPQRGLHFDDEDDASDRMEGDDVGAATIAEVVEADLDAHEPPALGQGGGDRLLELRMPGVDEPIELGTLRPHDEIERRTERFGHPLDDANRHTAQLAALDPRDHLARTAGLRGEICLPPPGPEPQHTHGSWDIASKHARIMRRGRLPAAYRAIGPVYHAPVTYEELLALARRLENEALETVTGKRFTVGIAIGCPFFTPESSGYGQSDGRKAAERFLERYNATGSLRPSDYKDVTRNASYFIGMIQHG
jgi:hypothetical protein